MMAYGNNHLNKTRISLISVLYSVTIRQMKNNESNSSFYSKLLVTVFTTLRALTAATKFEWRWLKPSQTLK